MQDPTLMHSRQCRKQAAEINLTIRNRHLPEIFAEIGMLEVWQHRNDLVSVPHGCDEWADGGAAAEVVEEVEFVEDAGWGGGDIYLLDCDYLWTATALEGKAVISWSAPPVALVFLLLFEVPVVVVFVVAEVFGFVDGGECAWVLLEL